MVQTVDPFQKFEKMVDEDGKPTDYFLRQWQFLIDAVLETTANEEGLAGLTATVSANTEAITAVQNIDLTAGVGLDGGGDLTQDRTFDLADTAVTPGQFGNATNVGQFTVDQQGRITQAANVAITGGGGGGGSLFSWPCSIDNVLSGSARAFKGNVIQPLVDITIESMAIIVSTIASATYIAQIVRLDSGGTIDEITAVSAVQTPGAMTTATFLIPFIADALLTAGSRYILFFGRTDGPATYVLPITFGSTTDSANYVSVPHEFLLSGSFANTITTFASTTPIIGDSPTLSSSDGGFGIGLLWSFT